MFYLKYDVWCVVFTLFWKSMPFLQFFLNYLTSVHNWKDWLNKTLKCNKSWKICFIIIFTTLCRFSLQLPFHRILLSFLWTLSLIIKTFLLKSFFQKIYCFFTMHFVLNFLLSNITFTLLPSMLMLHQFF